MLCNFKLPHICYKQCELVSERVLSYLSFDFPCTQNSVTLETSESEEECHKNNSKNHNNENNIYWLMRIYNFNELVLWFVIFAISSLCIDFNAAIRSDAICECLQFSWIRPREKTRLGFLTGNFIQAHTQFTVFTL